LVARVGGPLAKTTRRSDGDDAKQNTKSSTRRKQIRPRASAACLRTFCLKPHDDRQPGRPSAAEGRARDQAVDQPLLWAFKLVLDRGLLHHNRPRMLVGSLSLVVAVICAILPALRVETGAHMAVGSHRTEEPDWSSFARMVAYDEFWSPPCGCSECNDNDNYSTAREQLKRLAAQTNSGKASEATLRQCRDAALALTDAASPLTDFRRQFADHLAKIHRWPATSGHYAAATTPLGAASCASLCSCICPLTLRAPWRGTYKRTPPSPASSEVLCVEATDSDQVSPLFDSWHPSERLPLRPILAELYQAKPHYVQSRGHPWQAWTLLSTMCAEKEINCNAAGKASGPHTGGDRHVRAKGVEKVLDRGIVGSVGGCAKVTGEDDLSRSVAAHCRSILLRQRPPHCTHTPSQYGEILL
jgi:hypothetical protein